MDIISFDTLFQVARNEALFRQGQLTVSAVDREGSDANILFACSAAVGDECMGQLLLVEAGLFLDSATDAALDRLVFDRYGLTRKPASPAVGEVTFGLSAANPTPFTIPSGTILSTSAGIQFITTAAKLFSAGDTALAGVPVQSLLAGSAQQANINTITGIVGSITGAPSGITVTNPKATAGAGDAEADSSLRGRARNFFATARRGTIAAIINGALAVPGVQTAQAFEALDGNGHQARQVQLVIADQFTSALADLTPTPAAYSTQSQVFATTVFNALADVRAAGIYVDVIVAQLALQSFTLVPNIVAGANSDTVVAGAMAAIVGYTNALIPGQTWSRNAQIQLLKGVSGLANPGECIISPPNDIVPAGDLIVIRTTPGLVTVSS